MVTNKKMRQLIKKTKKYKKNVKLDITSKHLKELFDPPFKKVYDCVIIAKERSEYLDKYVEIRFHKVRDDEVSWLGDDIESDKKVAIGYICV